MNIRALYRVIIALLLTVVSISCANRGAGPQGGPKDVNPPVLEESSPQYGDANIDTTLSKIKFKFNENVAIKDAYKHLIVSPPLKSIPNVKASGKEVITTFDDTLQANTTYTIYYGDCITDNNEGNPLSNYIYSFSTGAEVDSMYIDGYVINALTLAPMPDVIAGVYKVGSPENSFRTTPLYRLAKTNQKGYFRIMNVAAGEYNLFAIKDLASTWYYSNKEGGQVAFFDNPVSSKPLSAAIDSISNDPIVLKMFVEHKKQEYFKKAMHPKRESFTLVFGNNRVSMLPEFKLLDKDSLLLEEPQFIRQESGRTDSLIYWVKDTVLLKSDTLRLEMKYLKSDSLNNLVLTTDTLKLSVPKKRVAEKKKKKSKKEEASVEEKKIEFIAIKHNFAEAMNVVDTITLHFSEPIKSISFDNITLNHVKDSVYTPVPITFETPDSVCNMELRVIYDKWFGETYRFNIDSASIESIYGRHNGKFYKTFKLQRLEEFANLFLKFKENPTDAVIELIDNNDVVKYRSVLEDGEVVFQDVLPGKYYMRMFIDLNKNGKWDTGDVDSLLQPEEMYYMPEELSLPANWDIEQIWDYKSFHILKQRPEVLNKQKKDK